MQKIFIESGTAGGPLYSISAELYNYLGMLRKGGGGGYPQALLEGLASEARY